MNRIQISIIVPVYNAEQYLSKCIESIIVQTYKNWELLLIDDGSPDNSGEICDEYAKRDNRIRVFHKSNGGVSSARNLGLEMALGEWVTFVDADDWISNNFIENLYKPILSDNTIEFVQGGCTNYINNKIAGIEQQYEYLVSTEPIYVFNHFRGLTVSKLFKLNIIRTSELKFDEQMYTTEDMAFTLDYILHITKYCFISEVGYYYRHNPNSLTHSKKIKPYNVALAEYKHLFSSVQRYIDKYQIPDNEIVFRKAQNARRLFYTLKFLYLNNYVAIERKSHLRNDFSENERSVIEYSNEDFISRVLLSFYKIGRIEVFDVLMTIIYRLKDIIR